MMADATAARFFLQQYAILPRVRTQLSDIYTQSHKARNVIVASKRATKLLVYLCATLLTSVWTEWTSIVPISITQNMLMNYTVQLKGHPLVCYSDGACHSKLQILRSATTHCPVLMTLLHNVCHAAGDHEWVKNIDGALCTVDFHTPWISQK